MADAAPLQLGPPLAEVTWDLRYLRRIRIHEGVFTVVRVVILVALLLGPWPFRWLALLLAMHLAVRLHVIYRVLAFDMQQCLEVYDAGLYLKKERSEAFIPWEQVEGFMGVVHRRPRPVAPRMTTGGFSSGLALRCGKRTVSLAYAGGRESGDAISLIEQRLLTRQAKG